MFREGNMLNMNKAIFHADKESQIDQNACALRE